MLGQLPKHLDPPLATIDIETSPLPLNTVPGFSVMLVERHMAKRADLVIRLLRFQKIGLVPEREYVGSTGTNFRVPIPLTVGIVGAKSGPRRRSRNFSFVVGPDRMFTPADFTHGITFPWRIPCWTGSGTNSACYRRTTQHRDEPGSIPPRTPSPTRVP